MSWLWLIWKRYYYPSFSFTRPETSVLLNDNLACVLCGHIDLFLYTWTLAIKTSWHEHIFVCVWSTTILPVSWLYFHWPPQMLAIVIQLIYFQNTAVNIYTEESLRRLSWDWVDQHSIVALMPLSLRNLLKWFTLYYEGELVAIKTTHHQWVATLQSSFDEGW